MSAPRSIELNKNILVFVHHDLVKAGANQSSDTLGVDIARRPLLRLDVRRDATSVIVSHKLLQRLASTRGKFLLARTLVLLHGASFLRRGHDEYAGNVGGLNPKELKDIVLILVYIYSNHLAVVLLGNLIKGSLGSLRLVISFVAEEQDLGLDRGSKDFGRSVLVELSHVGQLIHKNPVLEGFLLNFPVVHRLALVKLLVQDDGVILGPRVSVDLGRM
mmetsp:Transcript_19135/g.29927  ORF Transcript_19135/g.29927 Transcript_19135/m.29927 type:complete len:218 (+) Transcript_19135:409-1062(+)